MQYTLTMEDKDVQLVLNALAELPYKLTYEIINSLINQVQTQKQSVQSAQTIESS